MNGGDSKRLAGVGKGGSRHNVVETTVTTDRDAALEWFSEKLRLMLTFEGDPRPLYSTNGRTACPTWHTLRTPPFRFS
jgi:hypothetical protein